jgi:ferredoxin
MAAQGRRDGRRTRRALVALDIRIDREVCMGSGNCSFWAPGVFDLDDDGVAIVVDPEGADEEKILLAGQGCPTQAISIFRDGEKLV